MSRTRDALLQGAEQNTRTLSHSLAQHAARTIEATEIILADIVDDVQKQGMQDIASYLAQRHGILRQARDILLTNAEGEVTADSLGSHKVVSIADREQFQWHKANASTAIHIGTPVPSRITGQMIIPVSQRLNDAAGAFAGVAVLTLAPEYFDRFYSKLGMGPRGAVALWSDDGQLLARYPPAPESVGRDLHTAANRRFPAESLTSRRSVSPVDGVERIVTFEHLEDYPLMVSAAIAVDEVMAPWRREALNEGLVLGCGSLALLLVTFRLERHRRAALRSEAQSFESDRLYRLLADSSSDIVARLSLTGVRRYVSPASIEILGFTPDELVGTDPISFTHPDDVEALRATLLSLGQNELDQGGSTHRARHKDGHWVWLDAQFRLVRDEASGQPTEVVCSVRDVSRRQELQQQVLDGAALLEATLQNMDQGLIVLSPEGRIMVSNQRAHALLARSADADGAGTAAPQRLDWSLHDEIRVWLLASSGDIDQGPCAHRLEDGSVIELRQTLMPDGARLVTLSDITHLKRAEMEARDANRLLLMAEEVAQVGHWQLNLSTGRFTWSDEVFRIHGLDPSGPVPSVAEAIAFYHPDDRAAVERHVAEAVAHARSYEFTLRLVRTTGELRVVVARGRCETDRATGAVTGLFGTFMDVTDVTRVQRELGETSDHLKATLDNMDQGLVKVGADGRIDIMNRRFLDLLAPPEELTGVPRPDFRLFLEAFQRRGDIVRLATGETLDDVEALLRLDGAFERIRADGTMLEVRTVHLPDGAMVRTFSDVSARRKAESAVRDSETRYRMLADSTHDMITQLDAGLRRQYVSPASRQLLGFEPEEMVGGAPASTMHPDDALAVIPRMMELMSGKAPSDVSRFTYRMRHKEGHWVWVESSASLVRDPVTQAPAGLICSLRDMTERQRAARHLERAKAAAENATRQKTEFVANMSHELRTPLTGILGIHDLLQRDPTLGPQQRRYVEMARDAGRSLLSIVNDVLDFSKIEAGQLAIEQVVFRLGTTVEACAELAAGDARRKGLGFAVEMDDPAVDLVGDPARLRQVLLNLMTNAVKFTHTGGVTVRAGYDAASARLRVEVSDTGIGVPDDKLPLLFGRFSQADASITRRYGGTGLGLAICKRLVDLMGGEIGVLPQGGPGATFWFEVPLQLAQAVMAAESPSLAATARAGCRILLAEDNLVNQEIIAGMLTQRGHTVAAVDNGAAAAAAAQGGAAYDLILMDLQMPVMDGLSATLAIRAAERAEQRRAIPIVGLTANAMSEDVERCLAAGMMAHVAKPIDWAELFTTIDHVLAASARPEAPAQPPSAADEPESDILQSDILQDAKLHELAGVIGPERVARMLGAFVQDVERRMAALGAPTAAELGAQCHTLVSMAGQFGFLELARTCAAIQDAARDGQGLDRLDDLRRAAARAVAAARACDPARAA